MEIEFDPGFRVIGEYLSQIDSILRVYFEIDNDEGKLKCRNKYKYQLCFNIMCNLFIIHLRKDKVCLHVFFMNFIIFCFISLTLTNDLFCYYKRGPQWVM